MSDSVESKSSAKVGFGLLLGLLALVAAGKVILADTLDPDCFWHLRVGAEIVQQGWPHPLIDDLSFASIRQPWTPYSWLAEVGMKKLWDFGGFRAAVAVQAVMEAGFIFLLGLGAGEFSRRVYGEARYLASAVAAAVGGVLSLAYLSFRPVTAALTLLALIAWLLLRDRRLEQRSKSIWLVLPLMAVLINIHFFALFVPLWMAAILVGDLMDDRWMPEASPRHWRNLVLLFGSLAACCMTPLLKGMLRSILDYSVGDVMVKSSSISEFQPFYSGAMGSVSAGLVILLMLCVMWRIGRGAFSVPLVKSSSEPRMPMGELLWLAGSTILLFRMGRMSPVFAIIAVPMLAGVLPRLSDRILTRPVVIAVLAVVLAMPVFSIARAFPRAGQSLSGWLNRNGPDAPNYPCLAADFVDQHVAGQTHHLLCEFTWGGFLEWRLEGRFQTLMDGRTQVFTPQFWNSVALGPMDQRKRFLAATPADAAIVRVGKSSMGNLLGELHWKTVYEDKFARVLMPPGKSEIRNPNNESITKAE